MSDAATREGQMEILSCFPRGNSALITLKGNIVLLLTETELRTFMLYRVIYGYAGEPKILLNALKNFSGHSILRNDNYLDFTSEQAQSEPTELFWIF